VPAKPPLLHRHDHFPRLKQGSAFGAPPKLREICHTSLVHGPSAASGCLFLAVDPDPAKSKDLFSQRRLNHRAGVRSPAFEWFALCAPLSFGAGFDSLWALNIARR